MKTRFTKSRTPRLLSRWNMSWGGLLGDEEDAAEQLRALDLEVVPAGRVLPVVSEVAVELVVLIVLDLSLGTRPQSGRLVHLLERGALVGRDVDDVVLLGRRRAPVGLAGEQDRVPHVVAVPPDELVQLPVGRVLLLIVLEVEGDGRPPPVAVRRGDREGLLGVGRPQERFAPAGRLREDLHAVGHEEGGVEAHPELPDESCVAARLLGFFEELHRARMRDGAQVGDELVPGHAGPVVGDVQESVLLVPPDLDLEFFVGADESLLGQRAVLDAIDGIRRVGDQLAKKDLAVAVERIDDQVQDATDVGLELAGGLLGLLGRLVGGLGGGHRCRIPLWFETKVGI